MRIADTLNAADRLQRSRLFKLIASAVVLTLGVGLFVTYAVQRASAPALVVAQPRLGELTAEQRAGMSPEDLKEYEEARSASVATARSVNDLLGARTDPTAVGVGLAAGAGVALAVIWIGLGLTGLGVVVLMGAVVVPLWLLGPSLPGWLGGNQWGRPIARFIGSIGVLGFAFLALMEFLRLIFSGPGPVFAVARNLVSEAIRIRISAVFVVLLLLMLATLPTYLNTDTPLRYRVQTFLEYGTSGSFWLIALLIVFLSVSSLAFEQRDRIIWQTMTKPVASWQYLLGKWLGCVGVAAVLLTVSSTGVFLFTEYLRDQKALGEVRPYVAKDDRSIAEDRLILESQVLTARSRVAPLMPALEPGALNEEIEAKVRALKQTRADFTDTPEERQRIGGEINIQRRDAFLLIEPGNRETFVFTGLGPAKQLGLPVTLNYSVNSGGNDPRYTSRVTFLMENVNPVVQEVPFSQALALPISPSSIRASGELLIQVVNGDVNRFELNGPQSDWAGKDSIAFPPDGIQVFFPVGTYHANFLRVVLVLWTRLAFLAMAGIWAATFLSFPVASLVAFGVFLVAQSAGFMGYALEYFYPDTRQGFNIEYWKYIVRAVAVPVVWCFHFYADLKPTDDLVDGKMLSWTTVARAYAVTGLIIGVIYTIAVQIFKRRELATYSGQ